MQSYPSDSHLADAMTPSQCINKFEGTYRGHNWRDISWHQANVQYISPTVKSAVTGATRGAFNNDNPQGDAARHWILFQMSGEGQNIMQSDNY
jgi:ABC-type Fe3+ transport system substrate-binding protein